MRRALGATPRGCVSEPAKAGYGELWKAAMLAVLRVVYAEAG